jgi:myo-inositol-1(or 4)-monophosphatase
MSDASQKISGMLMRDYYELQLLQNSRKSLRGFYEHLIRRAVPKLQDELLKARPGFGTNLDSDADGDFWVFNVLEGEKNFLHALPYFTISIAHVNKKEAVNEVISAIVVVPALNEMFCAELGKGAWFCRFDMHQDRPDKLQLSGRRNKDELLCAVNQNVDSSYECRNFGSNAIALSYLAGGRVDAVMVRDYRYVDVAASLLIAKQAGAVVEVDDQCIKASTEYFRTQYSL